MKVLISKDYGAGWSTWNRPELAIDKDLIKAFELGCNQEEMEELCLRKGYEDSYGGPPYMGGFHDLKVVEIPKGSLFKIREYDGLEWVEIFNEDEWFRAEE